MNAAKVKQRASSIEQTLPALRRMTPAQLREQYLEVFGEPSRTGNKDFLFKRIAWRIQSLAEGDLSQRARQRAAELACDADIRMTCPKAPVVSMTSSATVTAPMRGTAIPIPGTI